MDTTKLKELAERATPGPWTLYVPENYQGPEELPGYGVECVEGRAIIWGALEPETGCQFDRDAEFIAAANPQAILGLIERLDKAEHHWANENSNNMALIAEVERLRGCVQEWERSIGAKAYIDSVMLRDEVDRLRTRLEIDERTPYDGIACRDETIKGLDEKCDRLKAENEVLKGLVMKMFEGIAKTDPEGVKQWMAAQEGGGR